MRFEPSGSAFTLAFDPLAAPDAQADPDVPAGFPLRDSLVVSSRTPRVRTAGGRTAPFTDIVATVAGQRLGPRNSLPPRLVLGNPDGTAARLEVRLEFRRALSLSEVSPNDASRSCRARRLPSSRKST